jgi:capsular exopolysaccharide synthesis family protein
MDLRAQIAVVRRHLIMVIVAVLIAGVASAYIAHRRVPKYDATALVLLQPGGSAASAGGATADLSGYAALQAQFVTLPANAVAAAKYAHDHIDPAISPNDWQTMALETSAGGSNVLAITTADANAKLAAEYANAFAHQYVESTVAAQKATIQNQIDADKTQIALTQKKLPTARPSSYKLFLEQQITTYQTDLSNQSVSLLLVASQPNAKLLNEATPAVKPSGTPTWESVLFGVVAGLLLGLGGAFLREQLDDRMRSHDDAVEAADGLPILAEAPIDRRAIRRIRDDGIAAAMTTRLGETARALRTAIMFLGVHREVRRILVTSGSPGEGKTLTSALLATAYAQAGFRTILISADLRQPRLEQLLGIVPQPNRGLTEALLWSPKSNLRGGADARVREVDDYLASQIDPTMVPNLSVLSCGPLPPNPGELLSSQRMEDLLGHLAVTYDMLIIDSAPLIGLSDSRVLASMVDGLVLVTAVGANKRSIRAARETLRAADIHWLGLVVNKAPGIQTNPYDQVQGRPARRRRHAAQAPLRSAPREVSIVPATEQFTDVTDRETIAER